MVCRQLVRDCTAMRRAAVSWGMPLPAAGEGKDGQGLVLAVSVGVLPVRGLHGEMQGEERDGVV